MHTEDPWFLASFGACALLWLVSYGLIIRRGFLDRSYGMPMVPLCVNISWEMIFGLVWPDVYPANVVNFVWGALDVVMVYQYLRFGRDEWPPHYPRALFFPAFLFTLAVSAASVYTLSLDAQDTEGGSLTGFGAQLLLSAASIQMLLRRNSPKGQSMYIGLARFLGTLLLIYAQEQLGKPLAFLYVVYVAFALLDLTYLVLLYRICRARGLAPWRHF
jgi:hypothetical protein